MNNVDVDKKYMNNRIKIYLEYLYAKGAEIYNTKNGYHIRNIPDILSYIADYIDDPYRIYMKEYYGREPALFHEKHVVYKIGNKRIVKRISMEMEKWKTIE
jgi:hypothetical protein